MRALAAALLLAACHANGGDPNPPVPPAEQPPSPALRSAVAAALAPYHVAVDSGESGADLTPLAADLRALYQGEVDHLVWFSNSVPRPALDSLLSAVAAADRDGLDPEDFGATSLRQLRARLDSAGAPDPTQLAALDVAASVAGIRLLRAIGIGEVDPRSQGFAFDPPGRDSDYAGMLRTARDSASFGPARDAARPALPLYGRVVDALARYRRLAAEEATWQPLAELPAAGTIAMGDTWPGVTALRSRLTAWGDEAATRDTTSIYDSLTASAVRRFQARHGLAADGVLGAGTLAELTTPLSQRVMQLELALERLRWFPRLPSGRAVVVKLPFYELDAYEDIQQPPAFSMRVVIGERGMHATPIFADSISLLVFRPYWNIPATLAARELVDTARVDSTFMAANQYEIIASYYDSATALPVTPERLDSVAAGTLFMRQRPGPLNSLGRVKFLFPNKDDIYLHDSPARSLFARDRRAFSHGCVRVDQPLELAAWLLDDQPDWPRAAIQAAMVADTPATVRLRHKVPVVLYYATATVDPDGTVRFADDPYGLDAALSRARDVPAPASR